MAAVSTAGYTYKWPRPAVTVDTLIFNVHGETKDLRILLIERGGEPFKGSWALPGGFVDQDEDLDVAAARELEEETSTTGLPLVQFGAFGKPGRDPRGHTVTVAYYAFLPDAALGGVKAGDDAKTTAWLSAKDVASSSFAFDHADVIAAGAARVQADLALGKVDKPSSPDLAAALEEGLAAIVKGGQSK
ncbi:nudF [Symbiodinium sp. KB8]|nr:nudF [Symbiodinium sp. KB8]